MKCFRFVGVGAALLAVVAFSAMAVASSASAITFLLAFWLSDGNTVGVTTLVETSGELLLENEKSSAGRAALTKCSGILDGFVGANSADDITEALTLGGASISLTALTGTSVTCELEAVCESSSKVWPEHLPWLTELELWEESPTSSGYVDLLLPTAGAGGNPGWYVECKTALLTVSEECTSPEAGASQTNVVSGVEAAFSEAFTLLFELKLALCTGNNEESGNVEGTGVTVIPGKVLSVSST
jgi:hypothetical protein